MKNILIVGNGHSFTKINFKMLPNEYKVMRFNDFFMEDKYYVGKRVDYCLGYSRYLDRDYYRWRILNMSNEYDIDMINGIYATVLFEPNKHFPSVKLATHLIQQNISIAEFRCFYEYYHEQYLPTGIQGIALAAVLGFNNIYLSGFDLFQEITVGQHPWDKEKININKLSHIHQRHPLNIQADFLNLLKKEFPNTKFLSVSNESPLNKYIDLAPVIRKDFEFIIETKSENSMQNIKIPELIKNKNRDFA